MRGYQNLMLFNIFEHNHLNCNLSALEQMGLIYLRYASINQFFSHSKLQHQNFSCYMQSQTYLQDWGLRTSYKILDCPPTHHSQLHQRNMRTFIRRKGTKSPSIQTNSFWNPRSTMLNRTSSRGTTLAARFFFAAHAPENFSGKCVPCIAKERT